jgi:hypothetical protein
MFSTEFAASRTTGPRGRDPTKLRMRIATCLRTRPDAPHPLRMCRVWINRNVNRAFPVPRRRVRRGVQNYKVNKANQHRWPTTRLRRRRPPHSQMLLAPMVAGSHPSPSKRATRRQRASPPLTASPHGTSTTRTYSFLRSGASSPKIFKSRCVAGQSPTLRTPIQRRGNMLTPSAGLCYDSPSITARASSAPFKDEAYPQTRNKGELN